MKYPWVGISLAVMWFGSAYIIINNPQIDSSIVLFAAIIRHDCRRFYRISRAKNQIMSFLTKNTRRFQQKVFKKLEPVVSSINGLEEKMKSLSDEGLKSATAELRNRLESGQALDDILPEAFAAVREASRRTLGQRHFDVQLLGGIILHQGKIAEMRTGEGKTLVATLPAYLNAISGQGVHVVTVNDYLSRRDAVWMGQIYNALGLTVGCINHEASYVYDPAHAVRRRRAKAIIIWTKKEIHSALFMSFMNF